MASLPRLRHKVMETPDVDIEKHLVSEFQKLDLSLNESRILVYLMTHGHSTAKDISLCTGIQRTETYNYISGLLAKGIVFSTFDRPQKYYSMSLEEVVDCLLQSKRNALEAFENKKKEYAMMLDALVSTRIVRNSDKKSYSVVMGENAINAKITRMLADATERALALLADKSMTRFYHAGIMDQLVELAARDVKVKLASQSDLSEYLKYKCKVECAITQKELPASFLLVDDKSVLIILEEDEAKSEMCGFYTNNPSMVLVFKFLFECAT